MADNCRIDAKSARWHETVRWLIVLLLIALTVQGLVLIKRIEPHVLPVRVIAIDGEVHRHSLAVLQTAIGEQLEGGIVTADLGAIKQAVESLPWIAGVSLKRVWPERLELRVVEHRPIARWGDDGLVTAAGDVFRPDPSTIPRGLPRLAGTDPDAPRVIARYLAWRERLATLELDILAMTLDARGAWRLKLGNEMEIALGSQHVDARLERFLRAYPTLRLAGLPLAVDLRYANGLAVRWADSIGGMRSAAEPAINGFLRDRS